MESQPAPRGQISQSGKNPENGSRRNGRIGPGQTEDFKTDWPDRGKCPGHTKGQKGLLERSTWSTTKLKTAQPQGGQENPGPRDWGNPDLQRIWPRPGIKGPGPHGKRPKGEPLGKRPPDSEIQQAEGTQPWETRLRGRRGL